MWGIDGISLALIVSLVLNIILGYLHGKHKSLIVKLTTKLTYLAKLLCDLEEALQDEKIDTKEALKLLYDAKKLIQDP